MPEDKSTSGESPLEKLQKQLEGLAGENTKLKQDYVNVQSAFNKRDQEIRNLRETVERIGKGVQGEDRRQRRYEPEDVLPDDDPYVGFLKKELELRDQRSEKLSQRLAEAGFIQEVGSKTVWREGKEVTRTAKDYLTDMEKIANDDPRRAARHSFRNQDGTVDYERSLHSFFTELRNTELEARDAEIAKQRADEAANRRRTASSAVISGDDVVPEGEVLDLSKAPESADDFLAVLKQAGLVSESSPPSEIGDSTKKQ